MAMLEFPPNFENLIYDVQESILVTIKTHLENGDSVKVDDEIIYNYQTLLLRINMLRDLNFGNPFE